MIFEAPFFSEMLLPFLLVFVLMFAILQKTKVLGDGKTQIDAIVAFVLGLLLIIAPTPRNMIVNMLPWLAVGLAAILTFMILYGFVAGDLSTVPRGLKITFGILAGVFTLGVVLVVTGLGNIIMGLFTGESTKGIFANFLIIAVVVAAIVVAMVGGKKGGTKS